MLGLYSIPHGIATWGRLPSTHAAVGLSGRRSAGIGMIALILNGTWPLSAIVLCITNDFVWWIPFGRYLFDAWPLFRADIMSSPDARPEGRAYDTRP